MSVEHVDIVHRIYFINQIFANCNWWQKEIYYQLWNTFINNIELSDTNFLHVCSYVLAFISLDSYSFYLHYLKVVINYECTWANLKYILQADEMVQQVKYPTTKSDDTSSISWAYQIEVEKSLQQMDLWWPHRYQVCMHTEVYTYNQ